MKDRKIIYWDIEASDLKADWGHIFCIGYQIEGEAPKIISIRDFPGWEKAVWDDKKVVAAFLKILAQDTIGAEVTHYGTNYDIPFLQARAAFHGLGVVPLLGHVDTFYIAKSKLALKSRRLGNLAQFLGVRHKKTPLDGVVWQKAGRGDEESISYIEKHCLADVRVLRGVYLKVAPLTKKHPVMNNYGACHNCGKDTLIRRGYYTNVKSGRQARFNCNNCGSWTHRLEARA